MVLYRLKTMANFATLAIVPELLNKERRNT